MALFEYATDEITEMLLDFCDCPGSDDGNLRGYHLTEAHDNCAMLPVMRLLDRALAVQRADHVEALAEQRERIAQSITEHSGPDPSPASPAWWSGYLEAQGDSARIARETP